MRGENNTHTHYFHLGVCVYTQVWRFNKTNWCSKFLIICFNSFAFILDSLSRLATTKISSTLLFLLLMQPLFIFCFVCFCVQFLFVYFGCFFFISESASEIDFFFLIFDLFLFVPFKAATIYRKKNEIHWLTFLSAVPFGCFRVCLCRCVSVKNYPVFAKWFQCNLHFQVDSFYTCAHFTFCCVYFVTNNLKFVCNSC